jgi:siroheme synthase-like protein
MKTSPYLPLFIDMRDKRVLVVGGGTIATRKVANLLRHGIAVRVIAPDASEKIMLWADQGKLVFEKRALDVNDAHECFLVYAATDDSGVNDAVIEAAHMQGALVCAVDRKGGEVITPSEVVRDEVQIAISTGGTSPARAKELRQRIEEWLDGR